MSGKIRNLLDDPMSEHITLKRLVFKLTDCAKQLSELEVKNSRTSLRNAKNAIKDFKRELLEFELMLNTTITQEVIAEVQANTKAGVVYGNPAKLVRKISKNNQAEIDKAAKLRKYNLELEKENQEDEEDDYFG